LALRAYALKAKDAVSAELETLRALNSEQVAANRLCVEALEAEKAALAVSLTDALKAKDAVSAELETLRVSHLSDRTHPTVSQTASRVRIVALESENSALRANVVKLELDIEKLDAAAQLARISIASVPVQSPLQTTPPPSSNSIQHAEAQTIESSELNSSARAKAVLQERRAAKVWQSLLTLPYFSQIAAAAAPEKPEESIFREAAFPHEALDTLVLSDSLFPPQHGASQSASLGSEVASFLESEGDAEASAIVPMVLAETSITASLLEMVEFACADFKKSGGRSLAALSAPLSRIGASTLQSSPSVLTPSHLQHEIKHVRFELPHSNLEASAHHSILKRTSLKPALPARDSHRLRFTSPLRCVRAANAHISKSTTILQTIWHQSKTLSSVHANSAACSAHLTAAISKVICKHPSSF
jgi:hypothetical protein